MDTIFTRRALNGCAGIASVLSTAPLIAGPAPTAFSIAHANHLRAVSRFNGLPKHLEDTDPAAFAREGEEYGKAADALDVATPKTWAEMIVLMEHMIGDGSHPGREGCRRLIAHARRLAGQEG